MKEVGNAIISRCAYAMKKIAEIKNVTLRFSGTHFKEFVVDFSKTGKSVEFVNKRLLEEGIIGGYNMSGLYEGFDECMLLCVTEINIKKDIDKLVAAIEKIVEQ